MHAPTQSEKPFNGRGAEEASMVEIARDIWQDIEVSIESLKDIPESDRSAALDRLTDCQVLMLDYMSSAKAKSLKEIYQKLEVWVRGEFGRHPNIASMSYSERLAFSAYRDLRDFLADSPAPINYRSPPVTPVHLR